MHNLLGEKCINSKVAGVRGEFHYFPRKKPGKREDRWWPFICEQRGEKDKDAATFFIHCLQCIQKIIFSLCSLLNSFSAVYPVIHAQELNAPALLFSTSKTTSFSALLLFISYNTHVQCVLKILNNPRKIITSIATCSLKSTNLLI